MVIELWAVFIILTLMFVYFHFTKNLSYWKKRGVPYAKPLPIVGNYLEVFTLRKTIGVKLAEIYRQFEDEPFVGTFDVNSPQLVIRDPELIKLILVKDFDYFYEHALGCADKSVPILAYALFLVKNPEWKALRALNGPLHTPGKIRNSFVPIEDAVKRMLEYLEKSHETCVDLKHLSSRYVLEAISSCAFSIKAHSFDDEKFVYKELGSKHLHSDLKYVIYQHFYYLWPKIVGFFKLPFSNPSTAWFLTKLIWEVVEERRASKVKRNDSIDAIIEMLENRTTKDDVYLEDNAILTQVIQYINAGLETTGAIMTFVLYELSLNPHVQTKLRREIQLVLQETGDIDYHTLMKMKYLDMVLSETARKYPSLPILDRRCMKDYNVPNSNLKIEKGCAVFITLLGLHYDPKYFPDPNAFKPERFSQKNKHIIPSFAYLPFGGGLRNCVGKRLGLLILKVMLVRILSNYKLETAAETPIPLKFEPKHFLVLSKNAVPIKMKKIVG